MSALLISPISDHSPKHQWVLFGLVPTLLEPEEEVLSLGDIEITRVLPNIRIAEIRLYNP
jgi:hypothetical protein